MSFALPPLLRTASAALGTALVSCTVLAQTTSADIAATPSACPPAPECRCPAPTRCPTATPVDEPSTPVTYRGKLVRANFDQLPGWREEDHRESVAAFARSCEVLRTVAAWQKVCSAAAELPGKLARQAAQRYFEAHFAVWQAINADESDTGMVTGYYEPLLMGSRKKTDRFKYPVYGQPQDLVTVDLSELLPELKHKRLRGRLIGTKVVPYFSRADIETPNPPLAGLELAWVDDPIDLFFLHIQGSGRIQLIEGGVLRVGYADQNGHPFRSLGRYLIKKGEIRAENASMQGIKAWARAHPRKLQEYLNANPSYVFFKALDGNLDGPIGTLGVPLTAERSVAIDARVIPLGPPVYLSTQYPLTQKPLNRLMVAQDTGGAINGGVRADFYWGFGDEAGQTAGRMKQKGRMWVLLPKGYAPDQIASDVKP